MEKSAFEGLAKWKQQQAKKVDFLKKRCVNAHVRVSM